MTTQELRELDAWIAEHVMGWKRTDFSWYPNLKSEHAMDEYADEMIREDK